MTSFPFHPAEEFCDKFPHTLVVTPGYWIECSRAISDQGSALTIAGTTDSGVATTAASSSVAGAAAGGLLLEAEDEGVNSPEGSLRGEDAAESVATDLDEKDSLLSTPRYDDSVSLILVHGGEGRLNLALSEILPFIPPPHPPPRLTPPRGRKTRPPSENY